MIMIGGAKKMKMFEIMERFPDQKACIEFKEFNDVTHNVFESGCVNRSIVSVGNLNR